MKVRSFTLTLSLATIVLVAIFVAVPLIAEQECSTDEEYEKRCEDDDRVSGYGIIEKEDNRVKAKAQCHANATIDDGWYWIHAHVLPYNDDYNEVLSNNYSGYLHRTVRTSRTGQPKSNGGSYVSIRGSIDDEDYYSVLIDLPD
jgi:hypothetical protein